MKTILLPTDFSTNATHALNYAIELAKVTNAKLIILNVFDIKYESGEVPYSLLNEELFNLKEESEAQLKLVRNKISAAGKLPCELLALRGNTVEIILESITKHGVDLMIMGTKGASGLSAALFGSNTEKVIEKCMVPLIAVPQMAQIKPMQKITFATNYKLDDVGIIRQVVEIARIYNAQVNVLHIADDFEPAIKEKQAMEGFMDTVCEEVLYNNLSFQILNSKNVEESLEEYIESKSTDVLAISKHHTNLFEKMFKKNLTKKLAYCTTIPLMVFHANK